MILASSLHGSEFKSYLKLLVHNLPSLSTALLREPLLITVVVWKGCWPIVAPGLFRVKLTALHLPDLALPTVPEQFVLSCCHERNHLVVSAIQPEIRIMSLSHVVPLTVPLREQWEGKDFKILVVLKLRRILAVTFELHLIS